MKQKCNLIKLNFKYIYIKYINRKYFRQIKFN